MRLRTLLLSFIALFAFASVPTFAATTPTEAAALAAAAQDHTAYTLSPAKLAIANSLGTQRDLLYLGEALWAILVLYLILKFRIAARMRNVANNLSKKRWTQGFLFFLQILILTSLLSLPFAMYSHHLAAEYGLSVQHWGGWLGDEFKGFLLTLFVGYLVVMLLFSLIKRFPRRWWLPFAFAMMAFSAIGFLITPYVIDPLFNKFEPLAQSNPALVQQLERVVARGQGVNIPPERMFLMKASNKVTTLNAYVTGFGASKRVVVWDTSIAKGTPDQILFIFGHEMGHYVLGHILRGMLFSFAGILIGSWLAYLILNWLIARYGTAWRVPTQDNWASLAILMLILSVFSFVGSPIANTFSRAMEHDADVFGLEAVHGIVANPQAAGQSTFQLLGENGYSQPDPSPFVQFWAGSHPPTWLRAAFAKHYDPWAPGAQPKFFKK